MAEHWFCSYAGVVEVDCMVMGMSMDAADLEVGMCMEKYAECTRVMMVQKTWSVSLSYDCDAGLRVGNDVARLGHCGGGDESQSVRSPNLSRSYVLLRPALDREVEGVLRAKRDLQGYTDSPHRPNG